MARQVTRRELLTGTAAPVHQGAGAPVRLIPRADLVNALEYEAQAKRVLRPDVFALIAGGDRAAFDRITLRPRMCVPVLDMDLGVRLFGDAHFAPIIVGPVEEQRRFHADGELATIAGAAAAKAAVVVSSRSSVPLETLAAGAKTALWAQVYAADAAARTHIVAASAAGCRAICLTVSAPVDWSAVGTLIAGTRLPVAVKGVTSAAGALAALQRGAQALIVSNHAVARSRSAALILALPAIVDAVAGKAPILVDGSFRRGTDVLKALAFGARAVLVARPVMWGLAAYGADGVQGIVEMLQTELARYMGMTGKASIAALDRSLLRVHSRA